MLEAPGRLLPRPMSLCLAPPASSRSSSTRSAPGHARSARSSRATSSTCSGRSATASISRSSARCSSAAESAIAPLPYLSEALGDAARDPRLPQRRARGGGRAPPERRGRRRAAARDRAPARRSRRRARLRPRADARGGRRARARRAARVGGADGLRLRRVLRLRRRDRRPATSGSASDGPVLQRGRVTIPLLNASGCLDALTAPDVARDLDAFVTKTVTPAAPRGQPAAADRRDGPRDAQLDRAAEPGNRRVLARHAAARSARSASRSGSRWADSRAADYAARLRAPRRAATVAVDRAEPLLPERRGGAGDGGRARRGARAATRSRSTRSSRPRPGTSPSPRGPSSPPARTASRWSTRSAASRSTPRTLARRSARERAATPGRRWADRTRVCLRVRGRRRPARSSAWAACQSGADALDLVAAGASAVALGTILFSDPAAPADPRRARVERGRCGGDRPASRDSAATAVSSANQTT